MRTGKWLSSGHLKYDVAEMWSICPLLRIGCLGLALDLDHRDKNQILYNGESNDTVTTKHISNPDLCYYFGHGAEQ